MRCVQVVSLRTQLGAKTVNSNDMLEYIKGLEPSNLQELTSNVSDDVLSAMNAFVQRLIGNATKVRAL